MKQWKMPPKIKIYEALGALADKRLKLKDGEARVYSSSGNKYYIVLYDKPKKAIMTNDNGSFWKDYLGYPAITYLTAIGEIDYDEKIAKSLVSTAWKDINQKNKKA